MTFSSSFVCCCICRNRRQYDYSHEEKRYFKFLSQSCRSKYSPIFTPVGRRDDVERTLLSMPVVEVVIETPCLFNMETSLMLATRALGMSNDFPVTHTTDQSDIYTWYMKHHFALRVCTSDLDDVFYCKFCTSDLECVFYCNVTVH